MKSHFFLPRLIAVLTCLGLSSWIQAQGTLKAKVTDEKGQPLYGVIVVAMENQSILNRTEPDGSFELKFPDSKLYTLNFVLMSYNTLEEKMQLSNGETKSLNFTMFSSSYVMTGIDVKAKAVKNSDGYLDKLKMNEAKTIDFISGETMKKIGDPNVVSAIARVSGVSTSGGLITVRGIGDRYVRTTLNGSRIPTLDPLTNNIKLDIFPASLIDNIIITKTQSADLPGDWAGAYISVETKDYPDQLTLAIESQFGYNPQSTFKDIITSDRSSTDWLGFDGGVRIRETDNVDSPNLDPSQYQEFVALGLGDYFTQLGVHGWQDGSSESDIYFRLGLVQLGLLSANQINDQAAFQSARNNYNLTYKPQAFNLINPQGTDYNSGFANNWSVRYKRAPINFTQNVSIGNELKLFGKSLGYFVGVRYGTNYRFDANGISQRVGDASLNYPVDRQDAVQIGRETNSWNALFNVAYKLNANHRVSMMFMPNFIGVNDVANYSGVPFSSAFEEVNINANIFYEQRKQLVYQFATSHFFPKNKLKIESNFSYTDGQSIAPDFKSTQYAMGVVNYTQVTGYVFSPTFGEGIRRFYRYLDENLMDMRLGGELPLAFCQEEGLTRKLNFGLASQRNDRKIDNDEYKLFANPNASLDPLTSNDLDGYLSPDKFIMGENFQYYYVRNNYIRNHSFGNSNVNAAFLSSDFEINQHLRLIGGLRLEHTNIFVDVDEYNRLGYARGDIRRENVGGFPLVNPGEIQQFDFLPNVSLVYKLKNEELGQTNLRMNYGKSLARPSIRELSDAAILDNEFRTLVYGNSDLKMVGITNYDFRAETYFKSGNMLSASAFYKDFKNHIEMGFGSAGITWENIAKSNVLGLEFEGKKEIGDHFELRANVTLVKSKAEFIRRDLQIINGEKVYTILDTLNRPMFGQAPYLVNSMITYNADSIGLNITASYNVQGPRLVIAGAIKGRPDVYEIPRHMIDLKVSKKLTDHWSLSMTIRDLLNTPVRRAYKIDSINYAGEVQTTEAGWYDYDRFRFGTNYQLSITYKL